MADRRTGAGLWPPSPRGPPLHRRCPRGAARRQGGGRLRPRAHRPGTVPLEPGHPTRPLLSPPQAPSQGGRQDPPRAQAAAAVGAGAAATGVGRAEGEESEGPATGAGPAGARVPEAVGVGPPGGGGRLRGGAGDASEDDDGANGGALGGVTVRGAHWRARYLNGGSTGSTYSLCISQPMEPIIDVYD